MPFILKVTAEKNRQPSIHLKRLYYQKLAAVLQCTNRQGEDTFLL